MSERLDPVRLDAEPAEGPLNRGMGTRNEVGADIRGGDLAELDQGAAEQIRLVAELAGRIDDEAVLEGQSVLPFVSLGLRTSQDRPILRWLVRLRGPHRLLHTAVAEREGRKPSQ
jgi:hypothetical protein